MATSPSRLTRKTMIALFDSGIGGLTVLKPLLKELPEYDYLYLGDSARSPYGGRSEESIKKFSEEAVEFLFDRGVKVILFACNTASSVALRHVQQKYLKGADEKDRKILGVLIPVAEEAAEKSKKGRVGVVGTKATIASNSYETEIQKINPEISTYGQACPLLVPFIEEGWHTKPEAASILKKYLRPLKTCNIDSLILGCTHYPMMQKQFERYMGKQVKVLDPGSTVAKKLKTYLERHPEIESLISKSAKPKRQFLTTDDPATFKRFAESYLSMKISKVEKVTL
jgi:glutamate racemase